MQLHDDATSETTNRSSRTGTERRAGWFFAALAVIGLLVLGFEHRAHLPNWLPQVLQFSAP